LVIADRLITKKKQFEKESLQHDLLINEVLKIRKNQKRLGARKPLYKLGSFMQEHNIKVKKEFNRH
jgi:hypothetical protein